ncbi:MAG: hypothetical protein LBE48_04825 [Methanomassiliicoccaceae archaeon]|jgi:uncharacterized YccA/Bax inhibitor family protein|nr:hypothetical protein [Methanomassiliicoccaceae archaeon]
MKCPKCLYDNPEDTIFCEVCDHRLDQPYRYEKDGPTMNPMYAVIVALILGAVATVLAIVTVLEFTDFEWFYAVIPGALGIVIGTYSLRTARTIEGEGKTLLYLAAAAAILSVVGFMLGIALI